MDNARRHVLYERPPRFYTKQRRFITQETARHMSIAFYRFPGPGASPIGSVWKTCAILIVLMRLELRCGFYKHRIHFWRFFGQSSGKNIVGNRLPNLECQWANNAH